MYLFEIFSIPFGVFLAFLTSKFRQYKKVSSPLIVLILLLLIIPVKIESTEKVYHIVNETEFQGFLSYQDKEGSRAVLDPWKAIAFSPLAKKEVYSRVPPGPNPIYLERNKEIFEFFNQSCSNKTFLKENEIDLVIGC